MTKDIKQALAQIDRALKVAGACPAQKLTPAERRARAEKRALQTANSEIRSQRRRDLWLVERW